MIFVSIPGADGIFGRHRGDRYEVVVNFGQELKAALDREREMDPGGMRHRFSAGAQPGSRRVALGTEYLEGTGGRHDL
jgi:hypothetical protein